jgi:hypothetical protein
MASAFLSSPAEIVLIDSRTRSGTVTLPLTNAIPYRVVSFKDQYGTFSNSTFTISTQSGESFDDGTTTKVFSNAFSYLNLYSISSKWMVMNATQTVQQTISSLTVNQLVFGTGAGWVQFGPVQASIVSSIQVQTQTGFINNLLIGNQSTINSAQFFGLFGNYNNTVLAEVSTGAGTQELLVFKGSSSSDRVRVQTTGNFVIETGVSARLFTSNTLNTLSNATPAFIVNASSNVGIQTATPGATLDVAGTGRFQLLSTFGLNLSSINGASPLSGTQLVSTTGGLQRQIATSDFISSLNLLSTTGGLQREFNTTGSISSANLISTTGGLQREFNTAGFISSLNLLSTTGGLQREFGTAGFLSTANLVSTTAGLIEVPELTSTTGGLQRQIATSDFISSLNLLSTTGGLQRQIATSDFISSLNLLSTTGGLQRQIATSDFISSPNLLSTTGGITSNYSTFFSTSLATYSFPYSGAELYLNYTQTVTPYYQLGINNIIGTNASNVTALARNTNNVFITGFQTDFYLPEFIITGLWTVTLFSQASGNDLSVYASLFQRNPTTTVETLIATSSNSPFIVPQTKLSLDLVLDVPYTTITSGNTLVLKIFANNTANQSHDLTTFYENGNYSHVATTLGIGAIATNLFQSTVVGLGSLGYVSTLSLFSTTGGLQRQIATSGFLSSPNLLSTTGGLQREFTTAGFLSTANLLSTTAGLIEVPELISTTGGLQREFTTAGFLSSLNLLSTTGGLQREFNTAGFLSTANLLSTTAGLIEVPELTSTTGGLQRQIATSDFISSLNLLSTTRGLGSIGYLSTIPANTSTTAFFTSSILASTITTSSLQVNSLTIGTGTGWVNLGPLQTVAISSIQDNTNALYANTSYFGTTSTLTALQFYGLFGNFNNTVLAEVSTGGGAQELLVFKGSSSSDRVRVQTTGNFVVETGVSARLFNSNSLATLSNATPAFIINASSNVGIQTATPGATFDVAGTARAVVLSSQQLFVSSINNALILSPDLIVSTTGGITRGYATAGFLSSLNLLSTTGGLQREFGTAGFVSSPNLLSSVTGLGSIGYMSSLSVTSSINAAISSFSSALGQVGGGGGIATIPANLSTFAFFTSSAVISTATIGIMSSLITNASTANITVATTSSVTTNTIQIGTGGGWIFTSPIQTAALSTNTIWADTSYVTTENVTTGIISTITTNSVTLGTGGGWLLTSPIQTSIVSSIFAFANQPFFDTVNIGSVSTMNSLEYYGLFGNYNNTVLAEISTGAGTQELLVFKGSSTSDRVRVQTTGTFVVETGVSARLFNSNTTQTLSNATPAFIINTSSNVGIQTASPAATLDVAGTGRFQSLSSLAIFASSIVAPYVFQPQFFTF